MTHWAVSRVHEPLTYAEAGVIGLLQGITELFPISSLGHAVLVPAVIGGQWATDLDVSKAESPYLAYIVGLHVATALAMILFFWRDWVRIIRAFFASIQHVIAPEPGTRRFEPQGTDQTLAWMIILATIPVGLAGVLLEHTFRTVFSKPLLTSSFLFVNGLILLAGERRGGAAPPPSRSRWPSMCRWRPSGRRPPWPRAGPVRAEAPALLRAAGVQAGAGEPRGAG